MNEFELIRTYFASQGLARDDVVVPIGDDAAVVKPPADMEQVLTTDLLVAGQHFLVDASPCAIGHKALAVNLSDLAAMGASPAWFTLNLSIPDAERTWLEGFADGLFELAQQYQVQLVGGDTVRGPLAVAVQVYGFLPPGTALLRSGARPGDRIYITNVIGDAGLALADIKGMLELTPREREVVLRQLDYPQPRVIVGTTLRDVASSCIDLSDGLLADLGHVLEASDVGARIGLDRIPVSPIYRNHLNTIGGWDLAITSGDDYELCFTVPQAKSAELEQRLAQCACPVTHIGDIDAEPGLRVIDVSGRLYKPKRRGYEHFSAG